MTVISAMTISRNSILMTLLIGMLSACQTSPVESPIFQIDGPPKVPVIQDHPPIDESLGIYSIYENAQRSARQVFSKTEVRSQHAPYNKFNFLDSNVEVSEIEGTRGRCLVIGAPHNGDHIIRPNKFEVGFRARCKSSVSIVTDCFSDCSSILVQNTQTYTNGRPKRRSFLMIDKCRGVIAIDENYLERELSPFVYFLQGDMGILSDQELC